MAPIPILARFARVAPLLGMIQKADHAQQGRLFKFKVKVKVNINTNLNAKTNARSNALDLKHRHLFRSWIACSWRTMIWKGAGKRERGRNMNQESFLTPGCGGTKAWG